MAELVLENLTKRFSGQNEICALNSLTLRVASGELLVLLGPSGSGKTTVLRLIAGLEVPTSGGILLNGERLDTKTPQERQVSMTFQYPALLPQLTVLGNLMLGPKLRGRRSAEAKTKAEEIARRLGLGDLLQRKPETLSGGQQQRAALARALVIEPRVLLLDEPLANLDPLARVELRDLIKTIQRELRVTTVYVTHDQAEAASLADRIALLSFGTVQQVDKPAVLYHSPANFFVARFIGPDGINLVEGRVIQEQEQLWFVAAKSAFRFPIGRRAENLPLNEALIAGFRPSSVITAANGSEAKIIEEVDYGWKKLYVVDCLGEKLRVQLKGRGTGETLRLEIPEEALLFFDAASGRRMTRE
jgi:multiple sugar transport system ATP-binding protein